MDTNAITRVDYSFDRRLSMWRIIARLAMCFLDFPGDRAPFFDGSGLRAGQAPSGKIPRRFLGNTPEISSRNPKAISAAEANALAEIKNNESRIGPGDLLDISIFEAPEMNRTLRVSANGEISMELLGAVNASGLTPR